MAPGREQSAMTLTIDDLESAGLELLVDEDTQVTGERLIGRYLVISKLGSGAMGVVFAAYDPELDRKVALKLLRYCGQDLEHSRRRLQREAQALARLDHPNVVAVYDVG
ncbi:MAG: protein kinase, partial [Myxococcales bacterium]|nr:protein kinase [Myxococcales bacterium]